MTDDLDLILSPGPVPDSGQREALLQATSRLLVRQARLRKLGTLAKTLALLLLGGSVGWLLKPVPLPEVRIETRVVTIEAPQPQASSEPIAQKPPEPEPELTPQRLELLAELAETKAERARLYREAGDGFLKETEIRSAMRCYQLYLRAAEPAEHKWTTNDSWLLASLKGNNGG